MSNLCYVLGCHNGRAELSAIHRHFGRVATCQDHHPDRAGIAEAFGSITSVPVPVAPVPPPSGQGGSRVARPVPATPNRPKPVLPSGGAMPDREVMTARLDAARAAVHATRQPVPAMDLGDAF